MKNILIGLIACLLAASVYNIYLRQVNKTCEVKTTNLTTMINYQNEAILQYKAQQLAEKEAFEKIQRENEINRERALKELHDSLIVVPQECDKAISFGGEQGRIISATY